jgi:hypothetical protein
VPALQLVQMLDVCAPVVTENVPAGQAVQSPTLFSPVVPE